MLRHAVSLSLLLFASHSIAQDGAVENGLLDHEMQTLGGQSVNLAGKYSGKVVLLVNVASKCGYTPQYEGLQQLHEQYAESGLAVVGVPCNQFGGQEPGSAEEIGEFCQKNYGVGFDMLAKVNVNAPDQCALYEALTGAEPEPGRVKWNFEKFLVGRDGSLVGRYRSSVEPMGSELTADIEQALAE